MRLTALLLVVACSCAARPPPLYALDGSFTSDERLAIWYAAYDWNDHVNEAHHIELALGGSWPWFIMKAAPPFGFAGQCTWGPHGSRILIRPGLPIEVTSAVARHELGHSLGLGHVRYGAMQANDPMDVLTDDDIAECKRVHACD